jgi:uncharacterized membrane protein
MAGPRPPRSRPAAAPRAGAVASRKDKGTRGGRPEAQPGGPAGTAQAQRSGSRPQRPPSASAARVAAPAPAEPVLSVPPPWFQLTTWVLSLIGLSVSIYLTIAHYTTSSILACSDKGTIDCAKVTTSPESIVFGIFPVAVLGLAFFVFMSAINSPWAWRMHWPVIRWARLGSVVVGIGFVLYLIYTELFTLDAICLWCTSVHVITFLLFALVVFAAAAGYSTRSEQALR